MPNLITLTCPQCGAKLEVADQERLLVCRNCGKEWTRPGFWESAFEKIAILMALLLFIALATSHMRYTLALIAAFVLSVIIRTIIKMRTQS